MPCLSGGISTIRPNDRLNPVDRTKDVVNPSGQWISSVDLVWGTWLRVIMIGRRTAAVDC
ncbi:hypothetical protein [Nocardia abscessus]|uniref:hypothetical protein n=1 Tax=Nocardia abscessus TaxID=120957 RepID=UPI00245581C0|nr:hypothetical protein [Nocardia abscessus]